MGGFEGYDEVPITPMSVRGWAYSMHTQLKVGEGDVDKVEEWLRAAASPLCRALEALAKRSNPTDQPCFCSFFNGGPMVTHHSAACLSAQEALAEWK